MRTPSFSRRPHSEAYDARYQRRAEPDLDDLAMLTGSGIRILRVISRCIGLMNVFSQRSPKASSAVAQSARFENA